MGETMIVLKRLTAPACAAAMLVSLGAAAEAPDAKPHTDADLWQMVATIAPTAASMQVKNLGTGERVLTIERSETHEPVITSIQVIAKGAVPKSTPSTLVLVIVHAPGECASPYAADDALAAKGLETFVVNAEGNQIWEVAKLDAGVSVRRLQGGAGPGAWERFKTAPADYTLYRCAQ
jgi:hypothetical protein